MHIRKDYMKISHSYQCSTCAQTFSCLEEQRSHYRTAFHAFNMKKKINKLPSISIDQFLLMKASFEDKNRAEKTKEMRGRVNKKEEGKKEKLLFAQENVNYEYMHEKKENYDDKDNIHYDNHNYLKQQNPNECLFTNSKNKNVLLNILTMEKKFGFYIPYRECLVDAEGLICELSKQVKTEKSCLWCNRVFSSVHGVQRHMIDGGHCKIQFHKFIVIFKEFYDFSNTDTPPLLLCSYNNKKKEKEVNDEIMEQKELDRVEIHMAPNGLEMVLSSRPGEIIGHRALVGYYRQRRRHDMVKLHKDRSCKTMIVPSSYMHKTTEQTRIVNKTKNDWKISKVNNNRFIFKGRDGVQLFS